MNIYVSNLGFNVTDEDLKALFAEYGEVTSAKVLIDPFSGKSRGFGFVEMPDAEAAARAISGLDHSVVDERAIRVQEEKEKENRPARPRNNHFSRNKNGSSDTH